MEFKWLCAIFFLVLHCEAQKRCAHRNFSPHEGGTDYGCVCNATYCDEIEPVGELEPGQIVYYVSSKKGERLNRRDSGFSRRPYGPKITVNAEKKYQKVMGFGGAISDSVGYNLRTLSDATQDRLLNAYYGNGGLDYTYTRVVVASSDFSTHPYSYDDFPNDFTMSNFRLTREDYLYKIPYIKKAQELTAQRGDNLHLFCTAWSPPAWMKTSNKMEGGAPMKEDGEGDYYAAYALYYKKYLEAYHNEGIDYWGMTPTNEPMQGHNATWTFQVVHMKPDQQRDFLKNHFGPMLKSSEITKNIKIMIGEETRDFIPEIIYTIMNDTDAAKYVDGFAVHWYEDNFTSPLVLDHFNDCYRDRFIFYTEGSTAFKPGEAVPFLGDWGRGAEYASNIITNMNHYSTGWVDWNLVLNQQGGPNWVNNFLDAAIIAIPDADEFIKQPMYYALGHFSKFVRPDYNRIDLKIPDWNVEGIAFLSPDGAQRVVVLHNTNPTESYVYSIEDEALKGQYANFNVKPNSLMTIVYKV